MQDYANGGGSTDPGASEERARSERSAKLRSRWSMHDDPGGGLAGHTRSARGDAAEGLACPARECTAGAGAGAPSESSLSAKLRSRRSRLDSCSWRLLLGKSGMPSRSMLGAKLKLMYNTCEAAPTERFYCSARCVESTCLFRLGGFRD